MKKMPRLKATKEKNKFKALVNYYLTLNNIPKMKIAKLWGIGVRATDLRINDPERIPAGDILSLAKILGCSSDELMKSIKIY